MGIWTWEIFTRHLTYNITLQIFRDLSFIYFYAKLASTFVTRHVLHLTIGEHIPNSLKNRHQFLGAKSPLELARVSGQKDSKLQDLASYVSSDQF